MTSPSCGAGAAVVLAVGVVSRVICVTLDALLLAGLGAGKRSQPTKAASATVNIPKHWGAKNLCSKSERIMVYLSKC
ncbi:hypothetical protein [Faucicola atlantae]|uniref:hypothetical protein n=1 Tax=Faucicola atlantae TaxID=34059 RepID=UPI0025B08388|nr:hypothetical protein [Moraxella atlantae]